MKIEAKDSIRMASTFYLAYILYYVGCAVYALLRHLWSLCLQLYESNVYIKGFLDSTCLTNVIGWIVLAAGFMLLACPTYLFVCCGSSINNGKFYYKISTIVLFVFAAVKIAAHVIGRYFFQPSLDLQLYKWPVYVIGFIGALYGLYVILKEDNIIKHNESSQSSTHSKVKEQLRWIGSLPMGIASFAVVWLVSSIINFIGYINLFTSYFNYPLWPDIFMTSTISTYLFIIIGTYTCPSKRFVVGIIYCILAIVCTILFFYYDPMQFRIVNDNTSLLIRVAGSALGILISFCQIYRNERTPLMR